MKPFLVLCLGNEILTDDAFGFYVANSIADRFGVFSDTDIVFAAVAGFNLLDLIAYRKAVLIIDTIMTGNHNPGHLHMFRQNYNTPSTSLVSSHQISLPVALKFGLKLGLEMPSEIDILAVEASDIYTLNNTMTPPVAQSINQALLMIYNWIQEKQEISTTNHKEEMSHVNFK
jgi:hydrogenase maturation protease